MKRRRCNPSSRRIWKRQTKRPAALENFVAKCSWPRYKLQQHFVNILITIFYFQDELAMCQRLKLSLESELERAEERISRQVEEKTEMRQILEEEKRKLLEAENVIEILKETMTVMDEQLQVLVDISYVLTEELNCFFSFTGI